MPHGIFNGKVNFQNTLYLTASAFLVVYFVFVLIELLNKKLKKKKMFEVSSQTTNNILLLTLRKLWVGPILRNY